MLNGATIGVRLVPLYLRTYAACVYVGETFVRWTTF